MKQQRRSKRMPKGEVVLQETTAFVTEPEVEIRKPATLAQALTEPAVRVIKPTSRVIRRVRKITRRAA